VAKNIATSIDWPLTITMLMLCSVGLGLLYSAGYNPEAEQSFQMKRQAISMGIGFLGFVVCMAFNTSFWKRWSWFFYLLGVGLLIAILMGGVVAGGSRRWLDLGSFRMQPSEFMKIALILALARLFSREKASKDGYNLYSMIIPIVVMLVPMGLIFVEPDLGTASCLGLIGGSMLLVAGVKKKTLLSLFITAIVLAIPGWSVLEDYQKQRILTFMSPESDPLGSGYHAMQSKIAVGSGSVFGKGFLEGTQTQLRFLPEQTTDFIFSVLAEEWGFAGSLSVVILYGFLVFRLLTIASRSPEPFSAFVAFGVAAMLFWHIVINICMVLGSFPVVGLTLPLLSYGGSSVVTVMAGLGIVAGISFRRFLFASR